ncbi:putative hydroxymethylpyrimidine transport system substrate-binding protein [Rhizobium sp. RU20A]|uniref:ABC transporter substrate-binding protein n=1 Tax=Rhizobium sp. RU20A TaxID=1907412 RepID=UPI0009561D6B|nr:ABC transporter substrate-binding protein [Rhizobium sp. RU20A]SIQ34182.1 putative hydroxymethylpyrimidine transport system substrate-binding protein [Rhizobium sp. RU20A]
MTRRLSTALAAALTLFSTLTASAHASDKPADKLTVMLEWFVNPDHAPLVIAKEKGYFAAEGLDVTLVPPADPSSVPRLVAAGEADIGIHYQPNLYLDHAAGLPLMRIGTLVETPLNTLTVLKDGPIKSLADLKGKTVGYSVAGFETALLGRMLANQGLTADDVTMVNVNFALSPSLIAGKVDATVGGFRNFELTQMAIEGHEGRAFYPEEHGVPAYDELIYVVDKTKLSDPRLPRFLAAVEKATIDLTNHPEEGLATFLKAYPDLDDRLNRQAFADTLPRFAKRPAALDTARYRRFGAFMAESGLIDLAPAVEEIAVEVGR